MWSRTLSPSSDNAHGKSSMSILHRRINQASILQMRGFYILTVGADYTKMIQLGLGV